MDLLLLAQSPEFQSPGFFTALVSDFTPDQRFALTIIGIGCATLAVIILPSVLVGVWSTARAREQRIELTRDLLDQGKSAEEIERIINPSDGFTRSMQGWFGGCKPKG